MAIENTETIKTPFINLQSDFGFKRAFGSERFRSTLIKFLGAVLGDEITVTDVRFHDKEILPSSADGKRIVYDIYCTMDVPSDKTGFSSNYPRLTVSEAPVPHHFILEMQNIYEPPFEERMVYYAFKLVAEQGKRGWNYEIDPVISIAVTDFDFSFLSKRILQDFQLRERETGEILTRKIRMLFLSLRQVPERWEECENELQRQLYLIKNMENLDKNSAPYKEGGYEELFDAAESASIVGEEMVRYSESLDRLRSYQAGVDYSRLEGIQEGMEKGMQAGLEKGMQAGMEKGKKEGLKAGKEQIAVRMIKSGMPDMMIFNITELPLEKIRELRSGLEDKE